MSREIKFRVWDKGTKRMHIVGENTHDTLEADVMGIVNYYNLQNGCGSLPDGTGTYELMQYTGIKDKNGREIYEGDILLDTEYGDCVIWQVKWYQEGAVFRLETIGDFFGFDDVDMKDFEIIGNIYENSDLLGGDAIVTE